MKVECGWVKSGVPQLSLDRLCVDTRVCSAFPRGTVEVYSSFSSYPIKSLDVGYQYWYSFRSRSFYLPKGTIISFATLKCTNDPNGEGEDLLYIKHPLTLFQPVECFKLNGIWIQANKGNFNNISQIDDAFGYLWVITLTHPLGFQTILIDSDFWLNQTK